MAYLAGQPVLILKEGSTRNRGRDAQKSNITAAIIVSEVVKSTLGPRGMDKMLVDSLGDVTVTNDGATVLDEVDVQNPAAKMMVEVAKAQDDEVGDGTTTAVLLAGNLLKRAQDLLDDGVHPTTIVAGYKKAADRAIEILNSIGDTNQARRQSDSQEGCYDRNAQQRPRRSTRTLRRHRNRSRAAGRREAWRLYVC